MHEMRKVIADPKKVVQVEFSDSILEGRDPYSVGTQSLHDFHSSRRFKREFMKLEPKTQLDLLLKIIEHLFY